MFENMRKRCLILEFFLKRIAFLPCFILSLAGSEWLKYAIGWLLSSSLNQICRSTPEPWLTYKEPHEGKYDNKGDNEDEKNHQMAKRSVALQSSLITLQNQCTVYEMTVFQQMCFLQSKYIILFLFREHEIRQCT